MQKEDKHTVSAINLRFKVLHLLIYRLNLQLDFE